MSNARVIDQRRAIVIGDCLSSLEVHSVPRIVRLGQRWESRQRVDFHRQRWRGWWRGRVERLEAGLVSHHHRWSRTLRPSLRDVARKQRPPTHVRYEMSQSHLARLGRVIFCARRVRVHHMARLCLRINNAWKEHSVFSIAPLPKLPRALGSGPRYCFVDQSTEQEGVRDCTAKKESMKHKS